MFKTLHRQLALICTLITGVIATALFILALHISETGLRKNDYGAFLSNSNTCISYIDNQKEISVEWLARMEFNYNFIISVEDNGSPLLFSSLKEKPTRTKLIHAASEKAYSELRVNSERNLSRTDLQRVEFSLNTEEHGKYDVSAALIPKGDRQLFVLLIHSLHRQNAAIYRQRILFLLLDILAVFFLFIFAWFFTRRVLRPVEENRKRQIQFVASASHELRTPLSVIMANSSPVFLENVEDHTRVLSRIHTEGEKMTRLVGDMLTLANADTGGWSMVLSKTNPDTLLLNIAENFEARAAEKNLELSVSFEDESYPLCLWDTDRIEQALSILIDNGIAYAPLKSMIRLSLKKAGKNLIIYVSDNGPGIPDEDKKAVFDRFYRRNTAKSSKDHFGLGLSIAYEIIRLHKGAIHIEDTAGGGTTFVISLPVN